MAGLRAESAEFARMWESYRLDQHTHGAKRFAHPAVGELRLNFESLVLPGDPGQVLWLYTADPGSASQERLHRLVGYSATPASGSTR
ncbi:MmyB family transcriptional regulator [Nocardioides anomalus]|uniref:MmyB family transcriptional regulator n=1 Tax=Nocardioides anomalus TaxID=2712223 RepID=UPI0022A831FB|nr:hypothetical protein [Nocardioides anomalus]